MKTWSFADPVYSRPVTNLIYSISNPNKNLEIIKAYGFIWGPTRTSESRLVLATQTCRKDCSVVFSNGKKFWRKLRRGTYPSLWPFSAPNDDKGYSVQTRLLHGSHHQEPTWRFEGNWSSGELLGCWTRSFFSATTTTTISGSSNITQEEDVDVSEELNVPTTIVTPEGDRFTVLEAPPPVKKIKRDKNIFKKA